MCNAFYHVYNFKDISQYLSWSAQVFESKVLELGLPFVSGGIPHCSHTCFCLVYSLIKPLIKLVNILRRFRRWLFCFSSLIQKKNQPSYMSFLQFFFSSTKISSSCLGEIQHKVSSLLYIIFYDFLQLMWKFLKENTARRVRAPSRNVKGPRWKKLQEPLI